MNKAKFVSVLCLCLTLSYCAEEPDDYSQLANEDAQKIPKWSYEKLVGESDLVAIIEPIEYVFSDDTIPMRDSAYNPEDFVSIETYFKVYAVLKGAGEFNQQFTVLHLAYSESAQSTSDANLIQFLIGPLQFEKRVVKPGNLFGDVELGKVTSFGYNPTWIAFLKQQKDGRFVPTTGQIDARLSFLELHEPSFYIPL